MFTTRRGEGVVVEIIIMNPMLPVLRADWHQGGARRIDGFEMRPFQGHMDSVEVHDNHNQFSDGRRLF